MYNVCGAPFSFHSKENFHDCPGIICVTITVPCTSTNGTGNQFLLQPPIEEQ